MQLASMDQEQSHNGMTGTSHCTDGPTSAIYYINPASGKSKKNLLELVTLFLE